MKFKKRKIDKNKIVICSHNVNSNALKSLANVLSEKVGYRVYRVNPDRVLGRRPVTFHQGIDKVVQFPRFRRSDVCAPTFATNAADIDTNFRYKRVVARTLTNSSEGKGIVVFEKDQKPYPVAPLYTEYIPKKKEFRVHVWDNKAFHVAEKRKKKSHEGGRDAFVRNTANGYVFCTGSVVEPDGLRALAVSACQAIGRTYGAVDIIWNEKENRCYVLEVNSRPGMEGTTLQKYAAAILESLGENNG